MYVMHYFIGEDPVGNPDDHGYTGCVFRDEDYGDNDYFSNGHNMWGNNYESTMYMRPRYQTPNDLALDFYCWYRFEAHIQWLGPKASETPALYYLRIYDDDNNLIVDEDSWYSDNYDGEYQNQMLSLKELYSVDDDSQGRRLFINGTHTDLMFGVNGNNGPNDQRFYLVDKVAFSSEGWIGE